MTDREGLKGRMERKKEITMAIILMTTAEFNSH